MSEQASVTFDPEGTEVTVDRDETLLAGATAAGVNIESLCGGNGLCGTCRVSIDAGGSCLSDVTDAEGLLLTDTQLERGYRLSCRCQIDTPGSIDVTIPPSTRQRGKIILTEGDELDVTLNPAVKQYHLRLSQPSLDDTIADRERVLTALTETYDLDVASIDRLVQRDLPAKLRSADTGDHLGVHVTVYDETEVIDLTPGYDESAYGIAVDIGTTTIAAYLLDLHTGQRVAVSSMLNPQTAHGEDIMSRMRYCRRQEDGRGHLQRAVIDGVNELIDDVTAAGDIEATSIYEAVFVGNTAMHHLFLGYDPDYVAGSPYVPARHGAVRYKARELDIAINQSGYLYWLPISGGWVGPDKVAVSLVAGHHCDESVTVCIDIGTNGEISVGNRDRLLMTSAPAGPALEGAELTDGVRAQAGAIDHVTIDPDTLAVEVSTIGDEPPIGICGSGVIDALAACFRTGIVDRRGTLDASMTDRVRENEAGELEFVLVPAERAETETPIVITQNDIRDVQMAKAAIQAGTRVLLDQLDITTIDRVIVAGGFGNFIDPDAARTIGLYPDVAPEAIQSLGNGAGIGAQLAALDVEARQEAAAIVEQAEYFEIAGTDAFESQFLQSMYLPHQRFETCPNVKAEVETQRSIDTVEQPTGAS